MAAILSVTLLATPGPVSAREDVEVLIGAAQARQADGAVLVELRFLNDGAAPRPIALPDRIEADLAQGAGHRRVWLDRAEGTPPTVTVEPGGFARARYRLAAGEAAEGALLSVPAWKTQQVATVSVPAQAGILATAQPDGEPPETASASLPPPPPSDRKTGNAFIDNLLVYQPIFAAYGPGTNTEALIQLSFRYKLFGSRQRNDLPPSWRDGLHFAYTQRMFWDLEADSSPFRNIDYQPELIYIAPSVTLDNRFTLSAMAGIRHESNGRDGDASRSINSIYAAPMAAIPLGDGYRLTVAPRLSLYIGDKSDNPDIVRYRGHGALFMEVGKDDGLRLSTSTRFNFSSAKGAVSADLSYPLPRLLGGGPDVYLFGQSFIGYGENLLDYNRRVTRFRIGLALVR